VTLPEPSRTKLVRLLGMLGSDHAGDRANAARMADQLVRERGLSWSDVVKEPPRPALGPPEWEAAAHEVMRSNAATDWERSFCFSLLTKWRGRQISEKQAAAVEKIVAKTERQRA
jgi:hypothetical protein